IVIVTSSKGGSIVSELSSSIACTLNGAPLSKPLYVLHLKSDA
ncbi:uncharacterized protein METZ01_LOCUS282099, partial [marine metagenome]